MEHFNKSNFEEIVWELAQRDTDLAKIIKTYGMPPMWVRPNSFATLVLTILEQQVSLASAFAAYKKLMELIGEPTPEKVLQLTDEELRACYFTRQKTSYVRGLALAISSGRVSLPAYENMPDEAVRNELIQLKGIGHWTIDIYLIHALQRSDIFPIGDLALVQALKAIKSLDKTAVKEDLLAIAAPWRPYRSIATMMLWHYYLSKRKVKTALQ